MFRHSRLLISVWLGWIPSCAFFCLVAQVKTLFLALLFLASGFETVPMYLCHLNIRLCRGDCTDQHCYRLGQFHVHSLSLTFAGQMWRILLNMNWCKFPRRKNPKICRTGHICNRRTVKIELRLFLYLSPPYQFHSPLLRGLSVTLATPYLFSLFCPAPVTTGNALFFPYFSWWRCQAGVQTTLC